MAPRQNYATWSADEIAQLRVHCGTPGMGVPDMAVALNRPIGSVRNKMQQMGWRVTPKVRGAPVQQDDATLWEARRQKAQEEVERRAEVYDWLRPVELPAPPKSKTTATAAPFTVVAGDFHFGMQDDRAVNVLLATVEALKPRRVILNGDTVDLLAVSRYPKDHRRGKKWELRDEVTAFHSFLHTLHAIGDGWKIEVIETSANHSGNGTDGRWWRYLNDRCPELMGHHEAEERLSYQSWFFPTWSSIRLVDSEMIADELLVLHGDIARVEAAYTAKASREKWMNSVLVNHTHRIGLSPKTVTAIHDKPTSYVRGYENGCLCRLEVPYGRALNWQQGFAVVCEDVGMFGVEQVFVDNGAANIAALGRTIRA